MLLYKILVCIIHGKTLKHFYKDNKFEISAPTWIKKRELPDGSYFMSDIQNYSQYIIKKHEIIIDNPPIRIYLNKIEAALHCYLQL